MITNKSSFLKLIGDESRLSLLFALSTGSLSVSELVAKTSLSQSLISHHLKDLKDGGLVECTKEGKRVYYRLTFKGKKVVSKPVSISVLKLTADISRAKLLAVLQAGSCSVSDLINKTGLEQSLISHHLKDLKEGGLVQGEVKGKWHFYKLTGNRQYEI